MRERGTMPLRRRATGEAGWGEGSVGNRVVISQAVVPPRSVEPVVLSLVFALPRPRPLRHLFQRRLSLLSAPGGAACRVSCRAAIYLILSPVTTEMRPRARARDGTDSSRALTTSPREIDDASSRLSRDARPAREKEPSSACHRSPYDDDDRLMSDGWRGCGRVYASKWRELRSSFRVIDRHRGRPVRF